MQRKELLATARVDCRERERWNFQMQRNKGNEDSGASGEKGGGSLGIYMGGERVRNPGAL